MSRATYFRNAETGVMSMDRRDMNRWVESGTDVEIWYYSETCGEWIMGAIREGEKKQ